MASDVLMPQMGESIAEGTIVRWIKKVGEAVDRDEPLFEISTDKVDAEIPSPAAGVLLEISVKEGETVPVNSVVARIGAAGEKGDPAPAATAAATGATAPSNGGSAAAGTGQPAMPAELSKEELRRQKSSPLVRKIAKEHGVDIRGLEGSGINGRVTKKDILGYIESGAAQQARPAAPPPGAPAPSAPPAAPPAHVPAFRPGERVEVVPMSVMRKKIAEHMVLSARTSPHVYSVYEVDFHRISKLRADKKAEYERLGANLTFTAFIAKAAIDALRQHPIVNASIDGDNIVYKKDINLGIAVALDWGLIVPVIRNADEKNMLGLARAINDLSSRARSKQLKPEEVQGGTFTITNPGIFGAVYGLPLINQPQAAILGVGSIDKRAVVVDDAIAIRPTCHLTLGYDHRIIDGADAGRFLSYLKERLETFDAAWV
ncbi:MAG TPA: dihydrolipoamide acetyltransferase family protein [Vicinamibacterales bacterium]|nr:dihydrolipoamide acetyltransferase family protein [Vicinamibacterales bacterium]